MNNKNQQGITFAPWLFALIMHLIWLVALVTAGIHATSCACCEALDFVGEHAEDFE